MSTTPYRFKRGSAFSLALEALSGDVSGASLRAVLKAATATGKPPGDAAAELAVFTVDPVDHVDPDDLSSLPGWILSLSAEDTAELTPGRVVTDARLTLSSGAVVMTQTLLITVDERVSEPAA